MGLILWRPLSLTLFTEKLILTISESRLFANQVPNPRLSAYTWSAANEWKNTASEAGAAAH